MYEIKRKIFLELTKTQKTALCNFLRSLIKKNSNLEVKEILQKFVEDENYYFEINSPHFEFLKDVLGDEKFLYDAGLYLKECKKYYEYKQSQAPLIHAQKEFEKKKRKFLQEVKMSKDSPTKKQLYYYESLCKRYNVEKKDTEGLSRLDLRNLIDGILNEHKTN